MFLDYLTRALVVAGMIVVAVLVLVLAASLLHEPVLERSPLAPRQAYMVRASRNRKPGAPES